MSRRERLVKELLDSVQSAEGKMTLLTVLALASDKKLTQYYKELSKIYDKSSQKDK